MPIRVQIRDGAIVPVDPLPPEWEDGRVLQLGDAVDECAPVHQNGAVKDHQEMSDDDVEWLSDEEYEQFKANIEEADREANRREDWVTGS